MNKKPKYSIVLSTNRDIKSLKWLLELPNPLAELIIIDKEYNDKSKKYLKDNAIGWNKVIYTPVYQVYGFVRNFAQGKNTGLLYAEGKYVINTDTNVEFKNNFWKIAEEGTKKYPNTTIIGQKSQERDEEIAWMRASRP